MTEVARTSLPRILIVDDTPSNLQTLGSILREAGGYRISLAASGPEALALCTRVRPDLILLDVMMPGMDGFTVIERLKARADTADIPVLFVTARATVEDVAHGLSLGGADYISKPVAPLVLLARVRTHLLAAQAAQLLREHGAEARRENERLREQVVRQDRLASIGQLAAGVTHDFNNLLGAILGHAELIDLKSGAESPLARHVQAILQSVHRAQALVYKLAALQREPGEAQGRFDLIPLLDELQGLLDASLRGIALEVAVDVPEVPCWLRGDAGEFQQVLINLCVNAGHALQGRRDGHIRIELKRMDHAVSLTVADNGCGIAADILPRIFDPFFTTREVGEGSGLGLAMAHGIVTHMGGSITCDSTPGEGSRFVLTFPPTSEPTPKNSLRSFLPSRGQETLGAALRVSEETRT